MVRCAALMFASLAVVGTSAAFAEPTQVEAPGRFDAFAFADSHMLLSFAGGGAGLDARVVQLGPGNLLLGLETSAGTCVTSCPRDVQDLYAPEVGGGAPLTETDSELPPRIHSLLLTSHARVGYLLGDAPGSRWNVYGTLLLGATYARTTRDGGVTSTGAPAPRVERTGMAPSFGVALGARYFPTARFFMGGEARARVANGVYEDRFAEGQTGVVRPPSDWSNSGPTLLLMMGVRL